MQVFAATNEAFNSIKRNVGEALMEEEEKFILSTGQHGVRGMKNIEIAIVSPELDRIRRVINVEGIRPKGRDRNARSISEQEVRKLLVALNGAERQQPKSTEIEELKQSKGAELPWD